MSKLTAFLLIIIFGLYTWLWFGYSQKAEYFSYITGRTAERQRIQMSFPIVDMNIGNKNFCVDGKLNVHEVKQTYPGNFKSQKKHAVK